MNEPLVDSLSILKPTNQTARSLKPSKLSRAERRTSTVFSYAKILYRNSLGYVDVSQSDALRTSLRHYAVNYAYKIRLTRAVIHIVFPALAVVLLTSLLTFVLGGSKSILADYSIGVSGGAVVMSALIVYGYTSFRIARWNPQAEMVYCLIHVLRQLEDSGVRLGDSTVKREICSYLQLASRFLDTGIPAAIRIPDLAARQRFEERCRSGALELRDMQARIALADDNTVNSLRGDISRYIEMVAPGKYGLLPTGTPAIAKEPRTPALVRMSKSVFIAFVPIGCLIGARYAGLRISGQLANWAIIVALAWAAITLISTFDPLYKTRLNDILNIVSIIRGSDGKG